MRSPCRHHRTRHACARLSCASRRRRSSAARLPSTRSHARRPAAAAHCRSCAQRRAAAASTSIPCAAALTTIVSSTYSAAVSIRQHERLQQRTAAMQHTIIAMRWNAWLISRSRGRTFGSASGCSDSSNACCNSASSSSTTPPAIDSAAPAHAPIAALSAGRQTDRDFCGIRTDRYAQAVLLDCPQPTAVYIAGVCWHATCNMRQML